MRISTRGHISNSRTPAEYFQGDPSLVACWPLITGYGLMDVVGGNHLIAADVFNGHGDFSIDADPIFNSTGGWTIAGGVATFSSASDGTLRKLSSIVIGKTYEFKFTLSAVTGIGVRPFAGATGGTLRNTPGTYTESIFCTAGFAPSIVGFAGSTATIDNWTVREVYDGTISQDGAYFNGVSNSLQSSQSIDLTGTNKVTVLADVKIHNYSLTADGIVYEFSVSAGTNTGSFWSYLGGTIAGDPLSIFCRGNVGNNNAFYLPSLTRITDNNTHSMVATYDFTQPVNEGNLSIDGVNFTASSRPISSNNTGNFGDYPLYIGSRAGTSLFSEISIKNLAFFSRVLSSEEIADYYAWSKDISLL